MAYPSYIKEKARQLRSDKKLTIDELAERLAIPPTTIYGWVRDLEIPRKPNTGWPSGAQRKGAKAMKLKFRRLRELAYQQGQDEFPILCTEPTFRDFVCMYIGERFKRDRNVVSICNSDPAVVSLGAYWIRKLTEHPIEFAFQHHADQDPRNFVPSGGICWISILPRSSSSESRTAEAWEAAPGDRNTACCRSAHRTPIYEHA